MAHKFACDFGPRDRVTIDKDDSLVGSVTGVLFKDDGSIQVEVSYVHAGDMKSAWVAPFRLTLSSK